MSIEDIISAEMLFIHDIFSLSYLRKSSFINYFLKRLFLDNNF